MDRGDFEDQVLDRLARIETRLGEVYATRGYVHDTIAAQQAACPLIVESEARRTWWRGGGMPSWLAVLLSAMALAASVVMAHSCT